MGISSSKSSLSFKISKRFYNEDIGDKLDDFEILQKLGKGGNGYAIKVRSKKNLKTYVIKQNPIEEKKEIIILTKLDHDNICKCLKHFEEGGYFYFLMDLYNNKDLFHFLSAYMQTNTKINEVVIWDILNQSLDALVYIHNKGLIHRDIKLGNIFMTDKGKVVIGDFGHCAVMKDEDLKNYTLNPQEQELLKFNCGLFGAPNFRAPEMSSGYYDQKVDVYSLGVCLYCLCCQIIPHPDNYALALQNNNYYSYDLRNIIYNMLIKDPSQRPTSSDLYQLYKQKYINIYVANTSIFSVVKCFFNYQNCWNYFSQPWTLDYVLDTSYQKEVALALLGIKNNLKEKKRVEEGCYVLRNILCKNNKVKDSIELSPSYIINLILIILYYELNEVLPAEKQLIEAMNVNKSIIFCDFKNYDNFINFYNQRFKSLISENFSGVLKKTFTCSMCGNITTKFQKYNFINFNLNHYTHLSKQNHINIIDIFNYYNNNILFLDVNNKHIKCKKCDHHRNHDLNKQFYCFPKNLIITFEKAQNNNKIGFSETIYLNEKKDSNTNYEYNLIGVINEIADLSNEHKKYVCYVKEFNSMNNNYIWKLYDEKSVNESGQISSYFDITNNGTVVALFYYCDSKNSFNEYFNNVTNINNYQFFNNMENYVNHFIFNNMFNNINYNNRNINNNLQMMNINPMGNNINIVNSNDFGNNININNNMGNNANVMNIPNTIIKNNPNFMG